MYSVNKYIHAILITSKGICVKCRQSIGTLREQSQLATKDDIEEIADGLFGFRLVSILFLP